MRKNSFFFMEMILKLIILLLFKTINCIILIIFLFDLLNLELL